MKEYAKNNDYANFIKEKTKDIVKKKTLKKGGSKIRK
jgi:hypothetical protein